MARPKEPIDLKIAKGKSHLTKAEIAAERAAEVAPATDEITAPKFLTSVQRKRFDQLSRQLLKIKIMGETDVEALARYIQAQTQYEQATKEIRTLLKQRPEAGGEAYYEELERWYAAQDTASRLQDRYFKQAQSAARDLGLTISSRCKLQVPVKEEAPKVNKFGKFAVMEGGGRQ